MGFSQDYPHVSKNLTDLQRFGGFMQVILDNVCDCVNTALFCLPSDGEGLTCVQRRERSPCSAECLD